MLISFKLVKIFGDPLSFSVVIVMKLVSQKRCQSFLFCCKGYFFSNRLRTSLRCKAMRGIGRKFHDFECTKLVDPEMRRSNSNNTSRMFLLFITKIYRYTEVFCAYSLGSKIGSYVKTELMLCAETIKYSINWTNIYSGC